MSQYPFSAVPAIPCPVCGAEPAARQWLKTYHGNYHDGSVILELDRPAFPPKMLHAFALVCTGCGYVQFFVDAVALRAKLG